jgi:hypothetical protein
MKRACFIAVVVVILAGTCLAQLPRQVVVVADVARTNRTGNTGGILFTPTLTGMFRVSFYVQCTRGSNLGGTALSPMLSWTDDIGADSQMFPSVVDIFAGPPVSSIFIIKAIAGTPVRWSVRPNTTGDNSVYEVYVALEAIGPTVP